MTSDHLRIRERSSVKREACAPGFWSAAAHSFVVAAVLSCLSSSALAQSTVTVTRTVSFDYDAYGNVSRQTVEPDDTTLVYKVVTDFGTNAFGSITSRTLSWQDPVLGAQSRVVETTVYDTKSRFPATVTNAKSQSETRTYDDATGNLTILTGPNGLTTSWSYDGWGRKIKESRADGTATSWAYRSCVDTCGGGAVSVTVSQNWVEASQTTVPREEFFDSLGRSVRSRTWGFDGSAILIETTYDAAGRLYQTSRPRYVGASAVWTTRGYDAIGRLAQVQSPSSSGSGLDTTTVSYSGLSKTTVNPKNQPRTETRNALGSKKSVTDAASKTVTYLYDPWGNLTRTTDALLNQIGITYDRLGRKVQLADPNLGTWTYSVDPLGQTWKQTDAKGQVTSFTYDALQRMTRRLESDLDSRWDYDTATTGKGKLAEAYTWVGDASTGSKDYRRIYAYDNRSRISSVTTHLDWDYVTETSYDAYQRPYRQDYRRNGSGQGGGPATGFYSAYNAQGYAYQTYRSNDGTNTLLEQIGAVDAEGHVTRESFGAAGAVQTSRGYNTYTGRIESIGSGPGSSGSVSPTLQNDSYVYDSLGNLSSRTQLVATSGAQLSEVFTYDNLNRLTTSLVGGQWTETTTYDAIGNVSSKTNVGTYAYPPSGAGSSRPNAVASITGNVAGIVNPAYSYDANGNTMSGLGRSYTWTSFNQPLTIDKVSGGSAVERTAYLYDTEHQRIRQTITPTGAGTTMACAAEGGTCTVPTGSTATVSYGANGAYFSRQNVTGSLACSNSTFGDPIPNVVKSCSYQVTSAAPSGPTACAPEGGTCSVPAGLTATVSYGANGAYFSRQNVAGSLACSNSTFGDPIPNVVKSCSYQVTSASPTTIFYAGAIEKEIDPAAGTTTIRTYAPGRLGYVEEKISGTAVASSASATRTTRLFLSDHLGSALAVVDESGAVLQRMNYDPWGRRRNNDASDDNWATLGTVAASQDHTGFTGQEQLDRLGLVNLNGRMYDPIAARMLSADPTIPDPQDAQALNRYSYVLDNPLAYTDASGFAPNEVDTPPDKPPELQPQKINYKIPKIPAGAVAFLLTRPVSLLSRPRVVGGFATAAAGRFVVLAPLGPVGEVLATGWLVYEVATDADVQQALRQGAQYLANAAGSLTASASEGGNGADSADADKDTTKRPSRVRTGTEQGNWDNAEDGANGSKLCPTCGGEVNSKPGEKGKDWDNDHVVPWRNRDLTGKDRKGVLDEYNRDTRLRCVGCNRSDNGK